MFASYSIRKGERGTPFTQEILLTSLGLKGKDVRGNGLGFRPKLKFCV